MRRGPGLEFAGPEVRVPLDFPGDSGLRAREFLLRIPDEMTRGSGPDRPDQLVPAFVDVGVAATGGRAGRRTIGLASGPRRGLDPAAAGPGTEGTAGSRATPTPGISSRIDRGVPGGTP